MQHRRLIIPALLGGALVVTVLLHLPILNQPFGRDQGIFAYIGDGILRGYVPYRDAWDHKPPGIDFAYALAFATFGRQMASVHILELVSILLTAIVVFSIGRRLLGVAAGLAAAYLYGSGSALMFEWWDRGQAEFFMTLPVALSMYCALRAGMIRDKGEQEVERAAGAPTRTRHGTTVLHRLLQMLVKGQQAPAKASDPGDETAQHARPQDRRLQPVPRRDERISAHSDGAAAHTSPTDDTPPTTADASRASLDTSSSPAPRIRLSAPISAYPLTPLPASSGSLPPHMADPNVWVGWLAIAGFFASLALYFKPTAGVMLAFLALLVVATSLPNRTILRGVLGLAALSIGALAGMVPLISYFAVNDALGDLYEAVITFNTYHVQTGANLTLAQMIEATLEFGRRMGFLAPLGVLGVVIATYRQYRSGASVAIWLAFLAAGVWIQGKFFSYHWSTLLAPLSLMASLGLVALWDALVRRDFGRACHSKAAAEGSGEGRNPDVGPSFQAKDSLQLETCHGEGPEAPAQPPQGPHPNPLPLRRERGQDPLRQERGSDPLRQERGPDPLRQERGPDPLRRDRGQDPLQRDRSEDPLRQDRGEGPLQPERGPAPSPFAKGEGWGEGSSSFSSLITPQRGTDSCPERSEGVTRWGGRLALLTLPLLILGYGIVLYNDQTPKMGRDLPFFLGQSTEQSYLSNFGHNLRGVDVYSFGAAQDTAKYVAGRTQPQDTVLVWGFQALVNFLADRRSPSRYVFNYPVTIDQPDSDLRAKARKTFLEEIERSKPKYIVLVTNDVNPLQAVDSFTLLRGFPEFKNIVDTGYSLEKDIADFHIYRRKGAQ